MISFASRRASWSASQALLLGRLAIPARLLGVAQALLDPGPACLEHARDRPEREQLEDDQEQDEVEQSDEDPEPVDDESGPAALRVEGESHREGPGGDREYVHRVRSVARGAWRPG